MNPQHRTLLAEFRKADDERTKGIYSVSAPFEVSFGRVAYVNCEKGDYAKLDF